MFLARVASTSAGDTGHAGAHEATHIAVPSTEELCFKTAMTVVADVMYGVL